MKTRNYLITAAMMYVMLLSIYALPANAAAASDVLAVGSVTSFNLFGEYSPRSRCRNEAKREWNRCRRRDRRPDRACDMEFERRKRECNRLRR